MAELNRVGPDRQGGASTPVRTPRRRSPIASAVAAVVVVAAAAVCVGFGFWQLDRLEQRRAQNAAVLAAMEQPPELLDAALAARIEADPDAYRFRRVLLTGSFAAGRDVVLRGRSHQGRPGVHLFSPLRLDGADRSVLVNRGWLHAADGASVDPGDHAEPGLVGAVAIVMPFPDAAGRGVPVEQRVGGSAFLSLSRLDVEALEARRGSQLAGFYVRQLADGEVGGVPVRLGPPVVDEGPHLSYAVQWFGFAAVFLVGLTVVAVRGAGRGRA